MNKLTLSDDRGMGLPKQFCHYLLLGIGRKKLLTDVYLRFHPENWCCPGDGRLVYACQSHIVRLSWV